MNPDQLNPTPNLQQPTNSRLKLLLPVIAVVVIVVGLAVYLSVKNHGSNAAATGEAYVTTNNQNNTISLTSLTNQSTKNGTGTLDAHVAPGTYSVTVTNSQLSASQLVTVTANHLTRVTVNPGQLGTAEPVTDRATANLIADSSGLHYTDSTTNDLYSVDAANTEHLLDSSHSLAHISWADPTYGIGQGTGGQLYVINGTSITPLSSPVSAANAKVSFAVAPNRQVYVSDGTHLFASQAGASFKQIYQSSSNIRVLAAGNAAVAIGQSTSNSPGNTVLLTVTPAGVVHQRSFESYQAAWSPSGKYLVVTGDETTIVTDSQLNQRGNIPATNVVSPAWLDDDTVFYGIASGLWRYDNHTGRSDLLARMPQGAYANSITTSRDSAYVYALLQTTDHSNNNIYHLYRLGLKGQPVSKPASGLSALLPNPVSPCVIGYLNFTRADVVVRGPAASASSCTQAAKSFIAPYTSILGNLQYQFSPN